jgi:glycosyltransferase involved in cell wall biosynthesis
MPGASGRRQVTGYAMMVVPGGRGGINAVADYLVQGWRAGDSGMQVRVVETRGPSLGWTFAYLPFAMLRLLVDGLLGRVALVHLNVASSGSTWRKLIMYGCARLVSVPVVVHLHGGGYRDFLAGLAGWQRGLVRRMFAGACRVLVLGETWRRLLVDELALADSQIDVLPNAVPDPLAGGAPPDRQADGTLRLLSVGRLEAAKGVFDLLQALADDGLRRLDWRLVLAGDGDVAAVRARARDLGLGDRVETSGWLDRAGIARELAAADIFVLPSYFEGLSLSLLEAMAYGLPAVATDVGAHGDVVVDGDTGALVAAGDVAGLSAALAELLTAPARARDMGRRARQRFLERYELSAVLHRLKDVYEDCGRQSDA